MSKQKKKSEINKKIVCNGQKEEALSTKENEALFKIAFRNYLNLVALADRKAGLLIQVNSIIASIIIGFVIRKPQDYPSLRQGPNSLLLAIPVTLILSIATATIFFAILASKPLGRKFLFQINDKDRFSSGVSIGLTRIFKE